MKVWFIALVTLMSVATVGQQATTLTGSTLLRDCNAAVRWDTNDSYTSELTQEAAYCLGYVNGVMAMAVDWQDHSNPHLVFLPCFESASVKAGQTARIVVKYLTEHPEKLHQDAHILVIEALNR